MNAPNKWFLHSSKIIRDYIQVTGGFHAHINNGLADWEAAHGRGEKPPPYVFRIFGVEIPPRTTWDVVLQSQLTDLLESNVLFELGFFIMKLRLALINTFATSNSPKLRCYRNLKLTCPISSEMMATGYCLNLNLIWIGCGNITTFTRKPQIGQNVCLSVWRRLISQQRSAAPTLESRCSRQLASAGPSHILRAFLQTPN